MASCACSVLSTLCGSSTLSIAVFALWTGCFTLTYTCSLLNARLGSAGTKAAVYLHPVLFDDATPFFNQMRDSVLVDAQGQMVPFPWPWQERCLSARAGERCKSRERDSASTGGGDSQTNKPERPQVTLAAAPGSGRAGSVSKASVKRPRVRSSTHVCSRTHVTPARSSSSVSWLILCRAWRRAATMVS